MTWVGSRLGRNIWEPYEFSQMRGPIYIYHSANIPINSQILSLQFRLAGQQDSIFGSGNFFSEDESGRKFLVTDITPNSVQFESFVRHNESLEFQIEIKEELDNPEITLETGGSVDSTGLLVHYRFDWNDGTVTNWGTSTKSTHTYRTPGTYYVRSQASSTGLQTAWTEPKIIDVVDSPILVRTPMKPLGSTQVDLDTTSTFLVQNEVSPTEPQEYRFSWGDNTYSVWSSLTSFSHSWLTIGTYEVKCQSRLVINHLTSKWSDVLVVSAGKEVVEPTITTQATSTASNQSPSPTLPYTALVNSDVEISAENITIGTDVQIQYRFDFGDSQQSS